MQMLYTDWLTYCTLLPILIAILRNGDICLVFTKFWKSENSNLVIFPRVGAFEQLFGPGREESEQKFSKNSNAQEVAQGEEMLKLRFDWYISKQ